MPGPFVQLQDKVVTRLQAFKDPENAALPFFSTTANDKVIPIFSERIGDLATKLATALNALGIGLIVLTPTAKLQDPTTPGDWTLECPVLIQIQENVFLNQSNTGTKVAAIDAVRAVMKALHFWSHDINPGPPQEARLLLDDPPFLLIKEEPTLTYNVALIAPLDVS